MPSYICKEEALVILLESIATTKDEEKLSVLQDIYKKIKALPQYIGYPTIITQPGDSNIPITEPQNPITENPWCPVRIVPLPNRPSTTEYEIWRLNDNQNPKD